MKHLLLVLLLGTAPNLPAQTCSLTTLWTGDQQYAIARTPVEVDESKVAVLLDGFGTNNRTKAIYVLDVSTCVEEFIDLSATVPNDIEEVELVKLEDGFLVTGIQADAPSRLYLGLLDDGFEKVTDTTLVILPPQHATQRVSWGTAKLIDTASIGVIGRFNDGIFSNAFYLEVDLGDFNVRRRTVVNEQLTLRDFVLLGDTVLVDDGIAAMLPPGDTLWRLLPFLGEGDLNEVRWQTNFARVGTNLYATGQSFPQRMGFRRGNGIFRMNQAFRFTARDYSYASANSDFVTYSAHRGLSVVEGRNYLVSTGTTGINFTSGNFPFVNERSEVYIHTYDLDLNPVSKRLIGGDAFYYNTYSIVHADHLVATGLKYVAATDRMEAFIHVEPLDQLVSSSFVTETTPRPSIHLTAHPNPTSTSTTFQGFNPASRGIYQILNTAGQVIRQGEFAYTDRVEVRHLPPGLYVFQGRSNAGERYLGRIVVR